MPDFTNNPFQGLFDKGENEPTKFKPSAERIAEGVNPFEGLFAEKKPEPKASASPVMKAAPPEVPKKETFLTKVEKLFLPRGFEIKLGLTEPTVLEQMKMNEEDRIKYWREKGDVAKTMAEEMKKDPVEGNGMLNLLKDHFIPAKIVRFGEGVFVNDARKLLRDQYVEEHPFLSIAPVAVGEIANLVLLRGVGAGFGLAEKVKAVAGLETMAPTLSRAISMSAESGSIFGISSFISELLNQATNQKLELAKLAKETGKGIVFGMMIGPAGALATWPARAAAGGTVMGGMSLLEGYLADKKIDSKDLIDAAINAVIGIGFELIGGTKKSEMFKRETVEDFRHRQMIERIRSGDPNKISVQDAEKISITLESLPRSFGNEFQTRIVRQLEGVPADFIKWSEETKVKYYNKVVDGFKNNMALPDAVNAANKAFNLPTPLVVKPTRAEISAEVLEKKLTGEERLRQAPKGAELLKEQLSREEEESKKTAFLKSVDTIVENILAKPEIERTTEEKKLMEYLGSNYSLKNIDVLREIEAGATKAQKEVVIIEEARRLAKSAKTIQEFQAALQMNPEIADEIAEAVKKGQFDNWEDFWSKMTGKTLPAPAIPPYQTTRGAKGWEKRTEQYLEAQRKAEPKIPEKEKPAIGVKAEEKKLPAIQEDITLLTDERLQERQKEISSDLEKDLPEEKLEQLEDHLDKVNAELEKRGLIDVEKLETETEEILRNLQPGGTVKPKTDENYRTGFEAEGDGKAKFDDRKQEFHSAETEENAPSEETKNRVSALKEPRNQLGYVINLIRAGKTVPEDLRWVIDNYNEESVRATGEEVVKNLGKGKYEFIFSDDGLSKDALDEFYPPAVYKGITDYTKIQENYGIDTGEFKENDVVKFTTDKGERWARLVDIFDNGRAIVETSTGEQEVDFWSLKKPAKLTKEQEKIAEGIFPEEKIEEEKSGPAFELAPEFMKKMKIKAPAERPQARRVPAPRIENKIFDILKLSTGKSNTLPVLSNIAIKGNKIMSTNLETSLIYEASENMGNIMLDAGALKGKSLEEISIDSKKLTATIGASEVKGEKVDDFPLTPEVKIEHQLEVLPESVIDGLEKVIFLASKESTRPEINSVLIRNEKGRLMITATDAFRLAQQYVPGKIKKDFEALIPRTSVSILLKILKQIKSEGKISIAIDGKNDLMKVSAGRFSFIARLTSGKYPDYKKIIPEKAENQFVADRDLLLAALNELPETPGKIREVEIKLDPKKKEIILLKSEGNVSFKKNIPAVFSEKPEAIDPDSPLYLVMPTEAAEGKRLAYNPEYLKDFLKTSDSSEVKFSNLTAQREPTVLQEFGRPISDMVREGAAAYDSETLEQLKRYPDWRQTNIRLRMQKVGRFYARGLEVKSANDVADIFSELKKESREKAYVLNLTKDNRIINIGLVSVGSVNAALIRPNEILKVSVSSKAEKIYFIHNHSGGDPTPSDDDMDITWKLKKVLEGTGIEFAGAVVINHTRYGFLDSNVSAGLVDYAPRMKRGKELSVVEMKQAVDWSEDFLKDDFAVTSPNKVARFFSELAFSKMPAVALLNLNSRNFINGCDVIGSSLDKAGPLKSKMARSAARYNSAKTVLVTNIDFFGDPDLLYQMKNLYRFSKDLDVEMLDAIYVRKDGTFMSAKSDKVFENLEQPFYGRVSDVAAEYGEFSEEEKAVIKAIQEGEPIPTELADAVESLREKGAIRAAVPRKEKMAKEKPAKEKPAVKDLQPGERISRRGITLSKSRILKINPYMVSYKTGDKRTIKTFSSIEEARRRFDIMTELRSKGALRRHELPAELQATREQKIEAHQIAERKNITPIQYGRLARAYTGVDSMTKMTPEQADEFIDTLKAIKPKFGGKISIARGKEIVPEEMAERKFRDITLTWLLNIFRSPANVFRKIGVGEEGRSIFAGMKLYHDFVNEWFSKVNNWQKELGVSRKAIFFRRRMIAAQSRRMFRAINNPEEKIELSEKESMIVARARMAANDIADAVDEARAEVGLEPMNRRENYITNLLTEESRQLVEKKKQPPNELFAMLNKRMPANIFNRLLFERKGGLPIKEDFWQALKAMIRVHGRYIHLNPPVHRFERFMRFYGDKIPQYSRKYLTSRINRFLGRPGLIDGWLRSVDDKIAKLLTNIPGLSEKVENEWQNGFTETIDVLRFRPEIMSKSLRTLKSIKYIYDLAFSVSFYTLNLTQFWLNVVPKLRGNPVEIYQSAFTGYAKMMMDFFRPSRWEYWRQRGVLTEIDTVIDEEYRTRFGGDILNLFAKLSEFNNRVAAALAAEENIRLLAEHGKFESLYKELKERYGEEAENYARNIADMTQFRFGIEEKPIAFDNPVMDLYYQYNTFALKQIEFTAEMLRNADLRNALGDFRKAAGEGKTKEFIAELSQGQRVEFIRFVINAFILSLILGSGYVWEAVFKGIIPNQVEGAWQVLKGFWEGDAKMRAEGFKQFLKFSSYELIEKVADYGIKATIQNAKMVKQLDLLRISLAGEGEVRTMAGKVKEKISGGTAVKRLFAASRETLALRNSKGWDLYNGLSSHYDNTRVKAIALIANGRKEEARQMAREYNKKALEVIKELKALKVTDIRLSARVKESSKSQIVSQEDFTRWIKEARKY